MRRHRSVRSRIALTGVCLISGCVAVDIDETDRDALFLDARFRKARDGSDDHSGPQVELGWKLVPDLLEEGVDMVAVDGLGHRYRYYSTTSLLTSRYTSANLSISKYLK